MKRTKKIIAISIMALLVFGGTLVVGTLIESFGTVRTVAHVSQAVTIDHQPYDQVIQHELRVMGGCDACYEHIIYNTGCEDAWLSFNTVGRPDLEGITVTYHSWICTRDETTGERCCGCGDELPDPFLLEAGHQMKFCICYDFDVMIAPNDYIIKSILMPSEPPE